VKRNGGRGGRNEDNNHTPHLTTEELGRDRTSGRQCCARIKKNIDCCDYRCVVSCVYVKHRSLLLALCELISAQ